ncbi:MAG: hypothetical protein ABI619_08170, partial [Betaproteobacteria bacterium]
KFAAHQDAKGFKKYDFRLAIEDLLKEEKIKQITEGPPSKPRSRLVVANSLTIFQSCDLAWAISPFILLLVSSNTAISMRGAVGAFAAVACSASTCRILARLIENTIVKTHHRNVRESMASPPSDESWTTVGTVVPQ